ncbi:MAG: hypothetical protein DMD82_09755 [Candidatus Rokuibacteriota bacterium]|nr:MAG: hypothetical protein DMD82_09755 [Candidatus Rokubacteria bacterium]
MNLQTIERNILKELQTIAVLLRRQKDPAAAESTRGDFFDAAQAVEHREREHLNVGRLADRARRLEAALQRVRAGNYGTCRECGEQIAPVRLEAIPAADACLRCQERLEHAPDRLDADTVGASSRTAVQPELSRGKRRRKRLAGSRARSSR